jgi:outer membrane protein OmpA-like peptidoglycan-associated protein
MRIKLFAPLILAGIVAAPIFAQTPQAQYSVEDIQKSFTTPDCSADPAPAECATGETADEGGPRPRTSATRGFSVGRTSSASKGVGLTPGGAKPGIKAAAKPAAPAAPARKDLLITFANGSTDLTPQAIANIRVFAKALKTPALSTLRFAIDGHTNAVGSRDSNLELSKARAGVVADLLKDLGVEANRLEVNGYGFDRLAVPSDPAAAANRRVEARRL